MCCFYILGVNLTLLLAYMVKAVFGLRELEGTKQTDLKGCIFLGLDNKLRGKRF